MYQNQNNQPVPPQSSQQPTSGYPQPSAFPADPAAENPDKHFMTAFLMAWLLGGLGIDRFYLGYTGLGIAKLLTGGGLGIWAFIDAVLAAFGKLRQKGNPLPLEGAAKNSTIAKIIFFVSIGFTLLIVGILVLLTVVSYGGIQDRAKESAAKVDLQSARVQVEAYYANNGRYPTVTQYESGDFIESMYSFDKSKLTNITYRPKPDNCDNQTTLCETYSLRSDTTGDVLSGI